MLLWIRRRTPAVGAAEIGEHVETVDRVLATWQQAGWYEEFHSGLELRIELVM